MATDDAAEAKVRRILEQRKLARERRAAALASNPKTIRLTVQVQGAAARASTVIESAGYLVAMGDSWFDYPFHDVLKLLDDEHGYTVESSAHWGDPVEAMAYRDGQVDQFLRLLEKVTAQGVMPKAILLSGGGNDIAGTEFGMLLNSKASPRRGWNREIIDGLLDERITVAYRAWLGWINMMCQAKNDGRQLPILVHGYDYPVPDGRPYLWGWPFPGPWLQPGFSEKRFGDVVENTALMRTLIDRFNDMLAALERDPAFPTLHHVDLRGTLSTDPGAYKAWWENELHPTEAGFQAVTAKFARVLDELP